jgi:hypothetical protein
MREHVKRAMKGTNPNIQKINQRAILAFPFPADVDVARQRQIIAYLDPIEANVSHVKTLQQATVNEVRMLYPSVLASAFNGGL